MSATRAADRDGRAGSVLPLVLVGLAAVGLLALAGYDSARFALSAARSQVAATHALHAADSGLELYVRGVGPAEGPLTIDAPPGRAVVTITGLAQLADSSRIVAVVSEGRARRGAARPVTRRLFLLVRIYDGGLRHRVPGSWRERF